MLWVSVAITLHLAVLRPSVEQEVLDSLKGWKRSVLDPSCNSPKGFRGTAWAELVSGFISVSKEYSVCSRLRFRV